MWRRLAALIVKEMLAVLRDPRGRMVLIVPPIAQIVIFAFAATMDVSNVSIAVLNRDSGLMGSTLEAQIAAASPVSEVHHLRSVSDIHRTIDLQRALAVVHIGQDFSADIAAGRPAEVQIILDGRRSNAAQILNGYLARIVEEFSSRNAAALDEDVVRLPQIRIDVRNWFNPNLIYRWFMVPSLIGTITLLAGAVIVSLSVARERELGTFDQLLVSPLRPFEIAAAKSAPGLIIGLAHGTLFVLLAVFAFGIPLTGSVPMLYLAMVLFLLSVIGVGLFISSLCKTQQQAILGAFIFAVPAILLSGFVSPVENMPGWMQIATLVNPLRHFLVVIQGVFLKDLPVAEIARSTIPLMLIAAATLPAAAWLFRKRAA